jgi:phosphoenolpyruvate---glycerone phosphotransferase subunit DhaL
MIDVIDAWLRLAADRIHEQAANLTALDQAIGDGDHGTNMDRGFAAIRAMLDAGRPEGDGPRAVAAARLKTAGRTLISTVGGAAGPLYGTALMRAGTSVADAAPDLPGGAVAVAALEAAIAGIQQLGKAVPGEKTMLDALVPAVAAGRAAVAAGVGGAQIASAMAEAAQAGALDTVPMLATKGRASYLGERSVGHQDPGATSAALLLHALADAAAGAGAG